MTQRPTYTLSHAMLIVRRIETSAERTAVFNEIKEKNRIIRWVDLIYTRGGAIVVRRLLVFLYMLKCVGSVYGPVKPATDAIAMVNFPNELHTLRRVQGYLPDLDVLLLQPSVRNMLRPAQIIAQLRFLGLLPRLWRLLGRLSRQHSFMPACRVASALAFYVQSDAILRKHKGLPPAIVASNYSPEALGLAAASHNRSGQVIYANHAAIPLKGGNIPPVLSDVAILYGTEQSRIYSLRSRYVTQAVYVGQPGRCEPMRLPQDLTQIGIFLTSLTRKDTIARLIAEIRQEHPDVAILIRHHPVALLETDLSDVVAAHGNTKVTLGTPLEDDIAACDVILCGNSSVTLNALRGGRPVGFVPTLDAMLPDYNGFHETGLVPQFDKWDDTTLSQISAFYQSPGWADIMRGYDASYGVDAVGFEANVRAALASLIRP